MLLLGYPHGPLGDRIAYEVEIEVDHGGVRVMVARGVQRAATRRHRGTSSQERESR